MDNKIINWLTEDDSMAVKYRTLTELLGEPSDKEEVVRAKKRLLSTLPQAVNTDWKSESSGLQLSYSLVALAECGITGSDIDVSNVIAKISGPPAKGTTGLIYLAGFDANCNDALILRALVTLGCGTNEKVVSWLNRFADFQLPDGGVLCAHWRRRFAHVPKSCIKNNMQILLLLAECQKQGIQLAYSDQLVGYFLKRRVFYRNDNSKQLVLQYRSGKRMIDNFFPAEPMRVGLPQLLYALSVLGAGNEPELKSAWELLDSKKNMDGKYILEGTMSKSYLPREHIGKASKWVTLYALLAKKYKSGSN
jgi:hypothetical protein